MSHLLWVATPVGQWPLWQRCAWMQPTAIMASRPTLMRSTPMAMATMASGAKPSLPEPANTTASCRSASAKAWYTSAKPVLNGSDTWSVNVSGPAPVPPSPPSMVMKSGPRPASAMREANSIQKRRSPTADLMPTGRPQASATRSTKSTSPATSSNSGWRLGLRTVTPTGTPLAAAMAGVTLAAGSTPPRPGLAP